MLDALPDSTLSNVPGLGTESALTCTTPNGWCCLPDRELNPGNGGESTRKCHYFSRESQVAAYDEFCHFNQDWKIASLIVLVPQALKKNTGDPRHDSLCNCLQHAPFPQMKCCTMWVELCL